MHFHNIHSFPTYFNTSNRHEEAVLHVLRIKRKNNTQQIKEKKYNFMSVIAEPQAVSSKKKK
jgi:hypothetical protein